MVATTTIKSCPHEYNNVVGVVISPLNALIDELVSSVDIAAQAVQLHAYFQICQE